MQSSGEPDDVLGTWYKLEPDHSHERIVGMYCTQYSYRDIHHSLSGYLQHLGLMTTSVSLEGLDPAMSGCLKVTAPGDELGSQW